jgi:uncharacterized membrane protein YwzB
LPLASCQLISYDLCNILFAHWHLQAQKLDEMLAKRGQGIDRVLNFQVMTCKLISTVLATVLHLVHTAGILVL